MSSMKHVKRANTLGNVEELLMRLGGSSIKRAEEAKSEAGGYTGSTTHPVKNVDDRLQTATEGSRSSENTSDIRSDVPASVDGTSPGTPGGQDSVQVNVGLETKATGEDAANETDKVKGGKDDPGSSHPARTDNDQIDGSKYSSVYEEFNALCKVAKDLGDDLLATIAVEATKSASVQPAAKQVSAPAAQGTVEFDKAAADAVIVDRIADTIKFASEMAENTAVYLYGLAKRAEGELPPDAGQVPGAADAIQGMGAGGVPEAGAGGPPPGMMPPGAGGPPPGAGGEAGVGAEDLAMLAQILQEAGISPEELAAAIEGGAGGPPPGAGGDEAAAGLPPEAAGNDAPKEAAALWMPKTAADLQKYARVRAHILEQVARNRR